MFKPADLGLSREALLSREQTAEALTALGYPIATATLETMAVRGGGPPYRRWGTRAVRIVWGDALDWAKARLQQRVGGAGGARSRHRGEHKES